MITERKTLLTALICAVALTPGCEKEPVEQPPVVRPIKTVTVGEAEAAAAREFPGSIRANQHADMGFEVAGRIILRLVNEGQQVKKGDELARLDDRDYQARLDQATARLRKVEADLNRSERIYEQNPGAVSKGQIDTEQKAVEVVEAEVRVAEKAVEDTVLRAPFDGIVARRLVEDFQNVQAKEPVFVVQDISLLQIVISIPERDIATAKTARDIDEITRRAQPRVQVSSLPGREFPARVSEIATTADPITRTFQLRLVFEPPDDVAILPGMTARVVANPIGEDVVRLPSHAALSDDSGAAQVWVLDPTSMTVSRRAVQLGELTGSDVQILDGLARGDLVAVSGISHLRDGMQVRRYER
jgi:RND family efflux transporter MFP subunit